MARISILDVGHGNCAVLSDGPNIAVIDAGLQDTLIQFLEQHGIKTIDDVLISHADKDHIAAIPPLLLDPRFQIKRIYVNSDRLKGTEIWEEFRRALKRARQSKSVEVNPSLSTSDTGKFKYLAAEITVLGPTPEMVLGGVGGKDLAGPQLTTHSLNVVLRIVSGTRGLVLLAGDMDQLALDSLINEKSSAEAKLLVFPHHGGHLGSSNLMEFVQKICGLVSPEIIVFSIGRGKHNTPRPEIIAAVKNRIPSVRIACTQLSEYCAANVPVTEPSHLTSEAARGKVSNSCCSGTLVLEIAENADSLLPLLPDHQAFITTAAPTALCKR